MGGALLKGWVANGLEPIVAVEPAPSAELKKFARANNVRLLRDIEAALAAPVGACVIALKPQVLKTEAVRLRPAADRGALMLSIAAGTSLSWLRQAWGRLAPIVRAMPNTPGAIGRGISVLYAPRNIGTAHRRLAQALLGGLGETIWVRSEDEIDAATAVSGSGPAYVFLLAEALTSAAEGLGLAPAIASQLARATVAGSGALLEADGRPASVLRQDVTSPGGTTEAALKVLMAEDGFEALLTRAVAAARARAVELRR
jgi:pyrroline-5-carboxylate reductase